MSKTLSSKRPPEIVKHRREAWASGSLIRVVQSVCYECMGAPEARVKAAPLGSARSGHGVCRRQLLWRGSGKQTRSFGKKQTNSG